MCVRDFRASILACKDYKITYFYFYKQSFYNERQAEFGKNSSKCSATH